MTMGENILLMSFITRHLLVQIDGYGAVVVSEKLLKAPVVVEIVIPVHYLFDQRIWPKKHSCS